MKFAEHVLARVMREPNKFQLVLRWLGHLASIAAIGLAAAWPTSYRNDGRLHWNPHGLGLTPTDINYFSMSIRYSRYREHTGLGSKPWASQISH